MLIKIKQLQGAECEIEIDENTPVSTLHELVKEKLNIDSTLKKMVLVYKGKSLTEENKVIKDYNISSGEKINLFLKPVITNGVMINGNESMLLKSAKFDKQLKEHLFTYYNEEQINLIVKNFHLILEEKINTMNYSDFEQLSRLWFSE